jgi:hypothetical protein
MRTPVIVKRSLTDNCISTDDSSNLVPSLKNTTEKSLSAKLLKNVVKKSNSQQFGRFQTKSPYMTPYDTKGNKLSLI